MKKPENYWKKKLTAKEYKVLREKGTELPFTGNLLHNKTKGKYVCGACENVLFDSDTKFDSGSGWPSFYDANKGSVKLMGDKGLFGLGKRTEVICSRCGSHLGHLFDDAPKTPTGKRYCINSVSLKFKKN